MADAAIYTAVALVEAMDNIDAEYGLAVIDIEILFQIDQRTWRKAGGIKPCCRIEAVHQTTNKTQYEALADGNVIITIICGRVGAAGNRERKAGKKQVKTMQTKTL